MSAVRRSGLFVVFLACALALRAQSTTPVLSQSLPAQSLAPGSGATSIDLRNYFALPGVAGQVVQFDTVLGKFNVELLGSDAPVTVANFLSYVSVNAYTGTIFHRSAALGPNNGNRIVQGGGYDGTGVAIAKFAPIALEYKLPNARGTIAMARSTDLNSATSEWYFNVDDNTDALGAANAGGYAVFGRVLGSGMSVVDAIAALPTYNAGGAFTTIPLRDVQAGATAILPANEIFVNSITRTAVFPAAGAVGVLSFTATSDNNAVATATITDSALVLTPVTPGSATVTVTVKDTNGNTATGTVTVTVGGALSLPAITTQPVSAITMASGTSNTVVFTVTATGTPAPTYQWQRNGVNVTGKTTATYVLTNASDAQAGTFRCIVTNSQGIVTSAPSVLSFAPAANPGRVINLSVLTALAASESMTMGTVLGGANTSGPKALLARAAGPSLTAFGVTGFLPDPQMSLVATATGTTVAQNNDWAGTTLLSDVFNQVGAFAYTSASSKDAALYIPSLPAGNYTVNVKDLSTGAGTVIAELYDATAGNAVTAATPRLINVSVLKQIATGGSLTAGFVIGGTTAKTVLVRAIGPGLAQFGLANFMPDPQLTLFNGSQAVIAVNDNWGGDAQLSSVGDAVGAFALSTASSKDAVIVITLAPGNYTAQVTGTGAGGSAIVEVYEVP